MKLGPTIFYKCPFCPALYKETSIMSSNNFFDVSYSDGYSDSVPRPGLTKCKACTKFFWISQATRLGEVDFAGVNAEEGLVSYIEGCRRITPAEWRSATSFSELNTVEFLSAIDEGSATIEKEELYLRKNLWWKMNDAFRCLKPGTRAKRGHPRFTENLERLLVLLQKENDQDHGAAEIHTIMKAEVLRQLRDFKKSLALLISIKTGERGWILEQLKQECILENDLVFKLRYPAG